MKSLLKVVLYAAISLAVLLVAIYLWGDHMPETHIASRVVNLDAPPEKVWGLITDAKNIPNWYSGVKKITPLATDNGEKCFTEVRSFFEAPLCVVSADEPKQLVHRTAEPSPFLGTWTYDLKPISGNRTQLTITEVGRVPNPILCYLNYQIGLEATIKSFEDDLQKAVTK